MSTRGIDKVRKTSEVFFRESRSRSAKAIPNGDNLAQSEPAFKALRGKLAKDDGEIRVHWRVIHARASLARNNGGDKLPALLMERKDAPITDPSRESVLLESED